MDKWLPCEHKGQSPITRTQNPDVAVCLQSQRQGSGHRQIPGACLAIWPGLLDEFQAMRKVAHTFNSNNPESKVNRNEFKTSLVHIVRKSNNFGLNVDKTLITTLMLQKLKSILKMDLKRNQIKVRLRLG